MRSQSPVVSITRHISDLPTPWRALLIVVVVALGLGYAASVLNLVGQSEMVDGKPGLTAQDVIVKYHGGFVETAGGVKATRMMTMINGEMRGKFETDENHEVVKSWLQAGALEAAFAKEDPVSPKSVLESDCTSCHSSTSGMDVATTSPFGPDDDTAVFAMTAKFTKPAQEGAGTVWKSPKSWQSLAMATHVHVLAVPIFVVFMGALFLWSAWPAGDRPWKRHLRVLLAIAPLTAFLGDVSCWWLARIPSIGVAFALAITVFGGIFAITYMTQWVIVMKNLCQPIIVAARTALAARRKRIEQPTQAQPASFGSGYDYMPALIDDDTFADLDRIDGQAAELTALLRELGAASPKNPKAQSGTVFNINAVLCEVADRAASLVGTKPVDIRIEPPNDPIMINSERYLFAEILFELVANGLRNTEEGTVTLAAEVVADDRLGRAVRLSVKETNAYTVLGGDLSALCEVSKTARISVGKLGGRLTVLDDDGTGSEFVAMFPLEPATETPTEANLAHARA